MKEIIGPREITFSAVDKTQELLWIWLIPNPSSQVLGLFSQFLYWILYTQGVRIPSKSQ
jgi:heme O synthase-like polyprenyltransferase